MQDSANAGRRGVAAPVRKYGSSPRNVRTLKAHAGIDVTPSIVAGAYLSIGIGQTYAFATNVAVDGVGVDLSAADLSFLAKKHPDRDADSDAIVNATTAGGEIVVSGANNNVVTVTLSAATTAAFDEHPLLYWQLKVLTSTNTVYGLDSGRMAIGQDVVRTVA